MSWIRNTDIILDPDSKIDIFLWLVFVGSLRYYSKCTVVYSTHSHIHSFTSYWTSSQPSILLNQTQAVGTHTSYTYSWMIWPPALELLIPRSSARCIWTSRKRRWSWTATAIFIFTLANTIGSSTPPRTQPWRSWSLPLSGSILKQNSIDNFYNNNILRRTSL